MENKLLVLNHKMNLTSSSVKAYIELLNANERVIVCPSTIYIPYFLKKEYQVGIQNISSFDNGAYTGEVSAKQAKSLGVNYAIIGHSERREYFFDTDEIVNKKVLQALNNHLNVILCVGEKTRKKGYEKIVKNQIEKALDNVLDFDHVFIAYEPVWAIGTGLTPTNDDIKEAVMFIKEHVKKEFKYENIKVLYGGSVNESNIETINQINELNGYLVGGASLKIEAVKKLIEVVL